ncbi:hypothetical protein GJ496_008989 [Pomphorhynchus laevis]|nr:hypothetical protein GJ496_008989 [Pomphorhynchus laevis]
MQIENENVHAVECALRGLFVNLTFIPQSQTTYCLIGPFVYYGILYSVVQVGTIPCKLSDLHASYLYQALPYYRENELNDAEKIDDYFIRAILSRQFVHRILLFLHNDSHDKAADLPSQLHYFGIDAGLSLVIV